MLPLSQPFKPSTHWVCAELFPLKTKAKMLLSSCSLLPACLYCFFGGVCSLGFTFLVHIHAEAFPVLVFTPLQDQFQLDFRLPDPISTQPSSISILIPGYLSLLPLPVHFLAFQFDEQVPVQSCQSLAFLFQCPTHTGSIKRKTQVIS